MKRIKFPILSWSILAFVIMLTGCSGDEKPKLISKAEGVLKNGDTPVANVRITFNPENTKFPTAFGITDENGSFSLKLSDTGKPGAVIGKNKVTLAIERTGQRGRRADDGSEPETKQPTVPTQFISAEKTPLEVMVESGKTTYDIDIKGK